jgi:hypothetical protein
VGENLLDYLGILDTGNDSHCSAADRAGLDVNTEDPLFQALSSGHRGAGYPSVRYWRVSIR